jgi:hypothetical protein
MTILVEITVFLRIDESPKFGKMVLEIIIIETIAGIDMHCEREGRRSQCVLTLFE